MEDKRFINVNRRHIITLIVMLVLGGLVTFIVNVFQSNLVQTEYPLNKLFRSVYGNPNFNFNGGFFNDMMSFFSTLGDAKTIVVITLLLAVVLFLKKYHLLSLWVLAVVSTGGILGVILKNIIERTRPSGHLPVDDGFSYPSGHSTASSLLILILILVFIPKIKSVFLKNSALVVVSIIWFLILYSRLYFGAHYLSDLLGGVFMSTFYVLTAMCLYYLTARWFKDNVFKKLFKTSKI